MLYGRHAIGTIGYLDGVPAHLREFTWALQQMTLYNCHYVELPNEFIYYTRAEVSYHAFARNSLVEQMKGDWLLQLDTDHRFDPDLCARMLNLMSIHQVDVLLGIYCYKTPPYSPVLYRWNGKAYEPIGGWDTTADIFRIDSAGGGCLMVKRSVFDRMRAKGGGPFDIEFPFGEDHSFFNRLRKLKIKAYCCPHIEAEHLRVKPVSLVDFKPTPQMIGPRHEVEGRIAG